MPIKINPYAVFDLETTDSDPETCQPIQIAAKIYNSRSLEPIPGSEFCEYCKPTKDCKINPIVYEITKIDPAEIEKAPSVEVVWPKFVDHINKYNSDKSKWNAPIPVAHNLLGFDLIIAKRMTELFCKKGKKTVLFNSMFAIDTIHLVSYLFDNTNELPSYKLDVIRDYMGLSKDGAHKANVDVDHLGMIAMRLIKFYREVGKAYIPKIKNCFKHLEKLANE